MLTVDDPAAVSAAEAASQVPLLGAAASSKDKESDMMSPLTMSFKPEFKVLAKLAAKEGNNKLRSFEFSNVLLHASNKELPQLVNCYGHTKPNEMLTVLGPNKDDQTALLRVLAGREHVVKDLKSGRFIANETEELYKVMHYGLVAAKPEHMKTSTVTEEFDFNFKLRFPGKDHGVELMDELVADLLISLHLVSCATKQISKLTPWELKRVAIGVELLSLPNVLFVNQPLVDNRKADWEVIQILQALQRLEICQVVVTLHAPASEIFHLVANHFLLLSSEGETLFVGNADDALAHFASKKFVLPDHHNTGDYLLLCSEFASDHLSNEAAVQALKGQTLTIAHAPRRYPKRNQWDQFVLLFKRELLYSVRDDRVLWHRIIATGITMALTGCVFLHVGDLNRPTYFFASHFVTFAYAYFALCLDVMILAALLLYDDKALLIRERSMYTYTLAPVLVSKLIPELVINFIISVEAVAILYWSIGWHGDFMIYVMAVFLVLETGVSYCYFFVFTFQSLVKSVVFVVLCLVPQLLFYGILVTYAAMPDWLSWLHYVCTLFYGLAIAATEELQQKNCGNNAVVCREWETLLRLNGMDKANTWWYCVVLFGFFLVYRILAFIIIQLSIWKLR